jgi:hypothetical protein
MPDFSTSIDIEPWEYISSCSDSEITELIESLSEDGHLNKFNGKIKPMNPYNSVLDDEWDEVLTKLSNSRHLLSSEDEIKIKEIAKKIF